MALSKVIRVIRSSPTRRDLVLSKGIYGSLEIHARTETLLHIGCGGETLSIPPQMIDTAKRIVNASTSRRVDVGYIIRELSRLITRQGLGVKIYSNTRYNDRPVIPGTSLKGAIRSRLELLFKEADDNVPSCFRLAGSPRSGPAPKGTHGWRHQRIWSSSLENRESSCSTTGAEYWEDIRVCIVCDMFGAPGLRSRINFSNLEPVEDVKVMRVGVLIRDRPILFEFIDKNSMFKGVVSLEGLSLEELGLLSIAMRLLEDKPILIGRFKYVRHRVKRDNNVVEEWFGRLNIKPIGLRIPFYADHTVSLLKENNIGYTRKGMELVVEDDVVKLLKLAEETAKTRYGKYLREVDEIEELEKLNT